MKIENRRRPLSNPNTRKNIEVLLEGLEELEAPSSLLRFFKDCEKDLMEGLAPIEFAKVSLSKANLHMLLGKASSRSWKAGILKVKAFALLKQVERHYRLKQAEMGRKAEKAFTEAEGKIPGEAKIERWIMDNESEQYLSHKKQRDDAEALYELFSILYLELRGRVSVLQTLVHVQVGE